MDVSSVLDLGPFVKIALFFVSPDQVKFGSECGWSPIRVFSSPDRRISPETSGFGWETLDVREGGGRLIKYVFCIESLYESSLR